MLECYIDNKGRQVRYNTDLKVWTMLEQNKSGLTAKQNNQEFTLPCYTSKVIDPPDKSKLKFKEVLKDLIVFEGK